MSDVYNDFYWAQQSCFTHDNYQKVGEFALRFSCPLCGDSEKNTKKARGNIYRHIKDGSDSIRYKCFNCNAGPMSVKRFLKETDTVTYNQYILDIFPNKNREKPKEIDFKVKTDLSFINKKIKLKKAVEVPLALDYLKSRKIPEHHYSKFYYSDNYAKFIKEEYKQEVNYEPKEDPRIVLKCEDSKSIIGLIGRSLNPNNSLRYMNAKLYKESEHLVFGLLDLDKNKTVYAIEGAFDSLFVENSISINSSALTSISSIVPKDKLVLIWDNEPRNREISTLIRKAIQNGYKVVIWPKYIKEKDINEMILSGISREQLKKIIDTNVYKGLEAQLIFNDWCKVL